MAKSRQTKLNNMHCTQYTYIYLPTNILHALLLSEQKKARNKNESKRVNTTLVSYLGQLGTGRDEKKGRKDFSWKEILQ